VGNVLKRSRQLSAGCAGQDLDGVTHHTVDDCVLDTLCGGVVLN